MLELDGAHAAHIVSKEKFLKALAEFHESAGKKEKEIPQETEEEILKR